MLRTQRARQAERRLRTPATFADTERIFTLLDGRLYNPELFSREFLRKVDGYNAAHPGAELPRIRLHDLRHTWATLALKAGTHPKIVAEQLGHSTTATTLEVYSHVTEGMQSDAAETVAAIIFGGAS